MASASSRPPRISAAGGEASRKRRAAISVYPPAQVREAYTELEGCHTRGKIVLPP